MATLTPIKNNKLVAKIDERLVLLCLFIDTGIISLLVLRTIALPAAEKVLAITCCITIFWLILNAVFGAYDPLVFGSGSDEYKRVINAAFTAAGGVGITCYLLEIALPQGDFLKLFAITLPCLLLGRYLVRLFVRYARKRGKLHHRVLIAGVSDHIDELHSILARETWLGYSTLGALRSYREPNLTQTSRGVKFIGDASQIVTVAEAHAADVVIIGTDAFPSSTELRRVQWGLESSHIDLIVVPTLADVSQERISIRPVAGLSLLHLERPQSLKASSALKRIFDVSGASLALLIFSPLMFYVAARIKAEDGGPVFYRQPRTGKDGKAFDMIKFRSMRVNAAPLAEMAAINESGEFSKIENDPRITKTGQWIRRYSVDEFPQLLNVLKGEMSMVGPRPPLVEQANAWTGDVTRRQSVRPGMTGLWQVSGRSNLSWDDTVRLDLYYVDNWSMTQDLIILLKTIGAVFQGEGAY